MTEFTIKISDQAQLDGIASERARYNANNPQNLQADDQAFFEWFMEAQFNQWAAAKLDAKLSAAVTAAKAGDPDMLAAVDVAFTAAEAKKAAEDDVKAAADQTVQSKDASAPASKK